MSIQKRLIYMVLGGILALSLFIGAFATFAQSGDGDGADGEATTETEPEAGEAENASDESSSEESADSSALPSVRGFGFRGGPGGFYGSGDSELLADALGISVDELEAAYETAAAAAIQQAVDEGLLTEEQAEALSSGEFGFHRGFGHGLEFGTIDFDTLLAEALGISVEALQDARTEVHTARLAEMVEAGAITQEQADLMLAQQAVREYYDSSAVSEALQSAYESAVNDALEAGAITQEQAELMLENMPSFDNMGFGIGGGRGFNGHSGHGGRGFRGPGGPGGLFTPSTGSQSSAETSGA
jgi:hypothetical protein